MTTASDDVEDCDLLLLLVLLPLLRADELLFALPPEADDGGGRANAEDADGCWNHKSVQFRIVNNSTIQCGPS